MEKRLDITTDWDWVASPWDPSSAANEPAGRPKLSQVHTAGEQTELWGWRRGWGSDIQCKTTGVWCTSDWEVISPSPLPQAEDFRPSPALGGAPLAQNVESHKVLLATVRSQHSQALPFSRCKSRATKPEMGSKMTGLKKIVLNDF